MWKRLFLAMPNICVFLLIFLFRSSVRSASLQDRNALEQAVGYLQKYGHIPPKRVSGISKNSNGGSLTSEQVKYGIKDFQTSVGLLPLGILDDETLEFMKKSRCGVVDSKLKNRRKRATEYTWPMTNLKYRFLSYTAKLPTQTTMRVMREAFKKWMDVCPLEVLLAGPGEFGDITLLFASGDHGDGFPFDGQSNGYGGSTLAHSFYPTNGGCHFDEDENWTDESYSGHNLLSVATHEFGHAFGLGHSSNSEDIMYPLYTPYRPTFNLSSNDVARIQQLYGPKNKDALPLTPSMQESLTTQTTTSTTTTRKPTTLAPKNNNNPTLRATPPLTNTNTLRIGTPAIQRLIGTPKVSNSVDLSTSTRWTKQNS